VSAEENDAGTELEPQAPEDASATAPEPSSAEPAGSAVSSFEFVIDVPLEVTVEIGSARMLVKDVLQLGQGSVIPLDRMSGDPADILVNGRVIAKGEVTLVEDRLAVRVTELLKAGAREEAG